MLGSERLWGMPILLACASACASQSNDPRHTSRRPCVAQPRTTMLGASLYGIVLDLAGEPAGNVTVEARVPHPTGGPPPNIEVEVFKTESDAAGEYWLAQGPGAHTVAFCLGRQSAVVWTNIVMDLQVVKRLDAVVRSAELTKPGVALHGAHRALFVDPSQPSCAVSDPKPRQRFYWQRVSHGDPDKFCR